MFDLRSLPSTSHSASVLVSPIRRSHIHTLVPATHLHTRAPTRIHTYTHTQRETLRVNVESPILTPSTLHARTLHSGTSITRFPAGGLLLRRALRDQGQELVAGVAQLIKVRVRVTAWRVCVCCHLHRTQRHPPPPLPPPHTHTRAPSPPHPCTTGRSHSGVAAAGRPGCRPRGRLRRQVCVHVCACARPPANVHSWCTHAATHARVNSYAHTHVHTHKHTIAHTHTYTRTHTQTQTHTHPRRTHTPSASQHVHGRRALWRGLRIRFGAWVLWTRTRSAGLYLRGPHRPRPCS